MQNRQEKRFSLITYQVICDTGFGFSFCSMLIFAQTNTFGFVATALCTLITAALAAYNFLNLKTNAQDNKLSHILRDARTPLRLLGTTMAIVAVANLMPAIFESRLSPDALLPAATSLCFATADFIFAAMLGKAKEQDIQNLQQDKLEKSRKDMLRLALQRPESYLAFGFLGIGLMSGPLSIIAFPLVITAYLTGMRNIIKDLPQYHGHSNLQYAGANFMFALVALIQGNLWLFCANMLNAFYMVRLEMALLPNGFTLPKFRKHVTI